jgi:hypothetical protein
MSSETLSVEEALSRLQELAPDAPFLALGQTVFWDEPMKAGVALESRRLGYKRRLVAGVHDTDYFAKLPSGKRQPGKFVTLPHNDTATRGLWSAAAEFSTLFGSETVVTRDMLVHAGLRIEKLRNKRPDFLDEATEAWGWRGIVSMDENPPVTAELPLRQVFPELQAAFNWALDSSVECIAGAGRDNAEELADQLRTALCDAREAETTGTLAGLYRRLLQDFYSFTANAPIDVETTATTELLRFNRETAGHARFDLLDVFVNAKTKELACEAYDQAVHGSGLYGLARFGTGAIPFDVVIPGHGRGTIRIGNRGIVLNTRQPQFITLKRPIQSVQDLAAAIEGKFGPNCVVVGKAVTLIGMLAREFVFVFHEGASGYVKHSRELHRLLAEGGVSLALNPILRIRYRAWEALQVCCSWLRLPEPFQRPFGTEEVCAPSFAARWREVSTEQEGLLQKLGELRRPIDLIRFLDSSQGGSWQCLGEEYEGLHEKLEELRSRLESLRQERIALYQVRRQLKVDRVAAEGAKGAHFRERIFEKEPSEADLEERRRLSAEVQDIIHRQVNTDMRIRELLHEQREVVQDPEIVRVHERRRAIEMEAELKRLRLIRQAVITSKGLERASLRPSAWWFRLVCPDGLWFRETVKSADYYLESLS